MNTKTYSKKLAWHPKFASSSKSARLNNILKNALTISRLDFGLNQQIAYVKSQIRPYNLLDTIERINQETVQTDNPLITPDELIKKTKLFIRLNRRTTCEKLTYKAYQILQKLIFEDFELIEHFTLNEIKREKEQYKSFEEKPEYTLLCQKYDKADIDYIINQYL